jgi:hypothetical protein
MVGLVSKSDPIALFMIVYPREVELPATGSWYRYRTVRVGVLDVGDVGAKTVTVVPKSKTGGWVMNLKAVLFDPSGEAGKH